MFIFCFNPWVIRERSSDYLEFNEEASKTKNCFIQDSKLGFFKLIIFNISKKYYLFLNGVQKTQILNHNLHG